MDEVNSVPVAVSIATDAVLVVVFSVVADEVESVPEIVSDVADVALVLVVVFSVVGWQGGSVPVDEVESVPVVVSVAAADVVLVEVDSVSVVADVVLVLAPSVFVPESIGRAMQPVHSRLQLSGISKLPFIPSKP